MSLALHGIPFQHRLSLLAIWLSLATCLACNRTPAPQMQIVVSADTQGWIETCECEANQAGGLARRASLLKELAKPSERVYLDAGGSASGTTLFQSQRLRATLEGMSDMGLEAHNIGGPESAFMPADLDRLAQETEIQWLSSNLSPVKGHLNLRRHVLIKRQGIRILVAGIIDPKLVQNKAWKVKDPITSVVEAFEAEDADFRIILAYMDQDALTRFAKAFPEFDALIACPGERIITPDTIGPVTLLSTDFNGKSLAHLRLRKEKKQWQIQRAELVEVAHQLPPETRQTRLLENYHSQLRENDFLASETGLVPPEELQTQKGTIAGSSSCEACHQAEHASWKPTRHARAWDSLVTHHRNFDPECQRCHTTGYGWSGGFENVASSRHRVGVGCEDCHGPSKQHTLTPVIRTPFRAAEQCQHCHDPNNSPGFDYRAAWDVAAHRPIETASKTKKK